MEVSLQKAEDECLDLTSWLVGDADTGIDWMGQAENTGSMKQAAGMDHKEQEHGTY